MLKQVLNKILVMLCTPFLSFRNKMNSSWDICLILFFFHHDSLFIFFPLTICSSLSSIYRMETAAWSSNSKSWMLACPKCVIYAKTLEVSYNFLIYFFFFFWSKDYTGRVYLPTCWLLFASCSKTVKHMLQCILIWTSLDWGLCEGPSP